MPSDLQNEVKEISGGTQIVGPPPAPRPQACLNGSAKWMAPQQRLGGKRAIQKAQFPAIEESGEARSDPRSLWRPVAIRRGGLRDLIGRTGVGPLQAIFGRRRASLAGGFLRLDRLPRRRFVPGRFGCSLGGGWMAGLDVDFWGTA